MNVALPETQQPELPRILRVVLLTFLVMVLPAFSWTIFAWLHLFLPLVAFYILVSFGDFTGKRLLLTASVFAAIILAATGNIELLFFAAVLLISGYVLFRSSTKSDSPPVAGLKTFLTISAGWLGIMFFSSVGSEISTYAELIKALDEGIHEALTYYRDNESVSADTLVMLEATLFQMKEIVPKIIVAILGSFSMMVTWFSMVVGNSIFIKSGQGAPWPEYGVWQLPERLIWSLIAMAVLAMLPVPLLKYTGINILLLLGLVYCFQGLAIAVFYMNKWKVPILIRSFFYVMMVLQSFGTLVLLILGITDIWFDFRKIKSEPVE